MASDGDNNHDQTVNVSSVEEKRQLTVSETTASSSSSATITRAPQPIFAIIAAPKVTSTSRDALIKWLKLRKEYEEATKERCKDGKEDFSAVLKSIKNSFDDDLLTTLCEASWGVCKSDLTDEYLLQQIRAITDSYQNQVLPPVNELFRKELTMNMENLDIQSRVTDYFVACNMLIKKYGFASFFEGEKGVKKKCKLLVNSLPDLLKEKVKNEIEYRLPEAMTNVLKLSSLINQQALEQAIEDRALKRGKETTRKLQTRDQPRPFRNNKRQVQSQQQQLEKRPKNIGEREIKKSDDQNETANKKDIPKDGCFHCGGKHYLSRCPTATQEVRDRLTAEHKKKGEQPSAGRHP